LGGIALKRNGEDTESPVMWSPFPQKSSRPWGSGKNTMGGGVQARRENKGKYDWDWTVQGRNEKNSNEDSQELNLAGGRGQIKTETDLGTTTSTGSWKEGKGGCKKIIVHGNP